MMPSRRLCGIVALALTAPLLPLLHAQEPEQPKPEACVLHLKMNSQGALYEARHRLTHAHLIQQLQMGCANGTLEVLLTASPRAKYGAVVEVTGLVTQYGPPGPVSASQPKLLADRVLAIDRPGPHR